MWPRRLVKPNASSSRAISSQRKLGYRAEDVPAMYHSFRHPFPSERVEAWKLHFFILPYPLASGYFPNGKLRMGNWTVRGKKRNHFSPASGGAFSNECSSKWFCKHQMWWQKCFQQIHGRGGVHGAFWPLVNIFFFLPFQEASFVTNSLLGGNIYHGLHFPNW